MKAKRPAILDPKRVHFRERNCPACRRKALMSPGQLACDDCLKEYWHRNPRGPAPTSLQEIVSAL